MALKVLVVEDSPFFQRVLKEIINDNADLNVIDVANNGQEAIEKVKTLKPDVVTMDYEMPSMDGLSAIRIIMAESPLPILILSSMSYTGAKVTIDALEAGAVDFMTKNFSEISAKGTSVKDRLHRILLGIGRSALLKSKFKSISKPISKPISNVVAIPTVKKELIPETKQKLFQTNVPPKLVIMAASTGGPAALSNVLTRLPKSFPCPIIVVQHMPENFTLAFSQRLNRDCQLTVKEAETGDLLKPGCVFLAPGGKQLIIDKQHTKRLKVIESPDSVSYKPSVDISMASVSNAYGKYALAIVLTGMGNDGCSGARLLKDKQATVWTQSEESCVIYGMPMTIDREKLSNASLPLDKMAYHLCAL